MPVNSKQKGARFERYLASIFRDFGYNKARRTAQYCGNTGDASDVVGLPYIHVEAKHQEQMDKIREQNRLRKQRQREREKELNCDGNVTSRDSHAIEEDKNKNKIKNIDTIEYNKIMQLYNTLCPSLPSVRSLSESRKKAIRARMHTYTVDDFKELFEKAEASDFLKGANDRNWSATFDWLIKDANMAKVLDGNYNKKKKNGFDNYTGRNYDMANLEKRLVEGGINHE